MGFHRGQFGYLNRLLRPVGSHLLNNCAAGHNGAGGRPALARSRSRLAHPRRVKLRLPAEPVVLAPTSNRKAPHEGQYISSMDSRAKRRKTSKQENKTMNDPQQWQQHRAFGAFGLGEPNTLRRRW